MLYYILGTTVIKVEMFVTIGGVQLPVKSETSDLDVIVDSKLRFDEHIASIVNKAHARAALIRRCFRYKDYIMLFRAFTVFVRPMLEYCSSVWNPHYYCHVAKIESVQRRFTQYIGSRNFMTYPERLQILKTESLELRRLKFDLNMIYCAIHGLNALDFSKFFDMCNSSSRGHSLKIRKQFSRVNCRAFSFANRCVDVWNSLNNEVVFASSLSYF